MSIVWARFVNHGTVTRRNITDWKATIKRQKRKIEKLNQRIKELEDGAVLSEKKQ